MMHCSLVFTSSLMSFLIITVFRKIMCKIIIWVVECKLYLRNQKPTVCFVCTDIIRTFCHGGCSRSTDLFRTKVHVASMSHQIWRHRTHVTHEEDPGFLCAKIVDIVLSSGISYYVVHWKSTDVSEEHITSIFRNQNEAEVWSLPASRWFHVWLNLIHWRWRQHVTPKCRLTFSGIQGFVSQKIGLFITTALRTSNPTKSKTFYCVGLQPDYWHRNGSNRWS
jgi:hypothetical protein